MICSRLLHCTAFALIVLALISATAVEAGKNCGRQKCRVQLYQRLPEPKEPCFEPQAILNAIDGMDSRDEAQPWGADSPCETAAGSSIENFWVTQVFNVYIYRAHTEQIIYDEAQPDEEHPATPRLPHNMYRTFVGDKNGWTAKAYIGDCVKEEQVKC